MVSTIHKCGLYSNNRVASQGSNKHGVLDSSIHGWDVFTRNTTSGDLVDEFVNLVALNLHWLELDLNLRELTRSTGLLLVGVVVSLNNLADGLAVGDLRLTNVCLNLELATHTVNQDV